MDQNPESRQSLRITFYVMFLICLGWAVVGLVVGVVSLLNGAVGPGLASLVGALLIALYSRHPRRLSRRN